MARLNIINNMFGIRVVFVDRNTKGLEIIPMKDPIGLRSVGLCDIKMENCLVKKENMLGYDGVIPKTDAFMGIINSLDFMKPLLSSQMIGFSEKVLNYTRVELKSLSFINYVKSHSNKIELDKLEKIAFLTVSHGIASEMMLFKIVK